MAGADVGDGLSLTIMVQLLAAGRLVPQLDAGMSSKNSVGETVRALNVIADVSLLVTVIVCDSDWVPCDVEGKVSEGVMVGGVGGTNAVPLNTTTEFAKKMC